MFIVTHRSYNFLILPSFLVGAVFLFFAFASLNGISIVELTAAGWLPVSLAGGQSTLWHPLTPSFLVQADWERHSWPARQYRGHHCCQRDQSTPLQQMRQLSENEDIILVFTEPKERVLQQLQQCGFVDDGKRVCIFPSLDAGVAWCEDRILAQQADRLDRAVSLEQGLRQLLRVAPGDPQQERRLVSLMSHFKRIDIAAGEALITLGDMADDLCFVASGQVMAQLQRPKMSLNDLRRLEDTDPDTASTLHHVIVLLLAERVVNMTNSIKALEG